MKTKILIFAVLILVFFSSPVLAGPGDTITIQTFENEGFPVGSGWLAPREGHFDFTSVTGLEFEKIIIDYNLKCDPSQNPSCGEWDYLSYIKVMEHTGKGEDPNFIVGGNGGFRPAEFPYMNSISWLYKSRFEQSILYDNSGAITEFEIGRASENMTNVFNANQTDQRSFFLYKAGELLTSGLSAGSISGMQFDVNTTGSELKRLNIRIKQVAELDLSSNVDTAGFVTVYSKDTQFMNTGWQNLDFTTFVNWDGTSNLLVDLYYSSENGNISTEVNGSTYAWNCASQSINTDNFFNFNGPDYIDIPTNNLGTINQQITVSFWMYGNPEQPQNDCIFEAKDAEGNRVLNVHLPWSDGKVYWDAGNSGATDRISKHTENSEQFKGKWNHWAFTKISPFPGRMKIYLNGQLWHSTVANTRSIGLIDTFLIGKEIGHSSNFYDGRIDEFQVWSKELSQEDIAEWMHKDIDNTHPDYADLLAYYQFNETSGLRTDDEITGQSADIIGIPQRMNYQGTRFKNFETSMQRPNVKFVRNTSNFTVSNELVVDSFPQGEVMIDKYIQLAPGDKPVLDETVYVYPAYYNNYIYDVDGLATDSTLVTPDGTLVFEMIEYNTTTPGEEFLIPWEIGRFITPYGNNLSLGDEGWTWQYDVTDFQHLFEGDDVILHAGNFQELLDMKIHFIEGTPPRELLKIENLYSANPQLSNFDNEITDTLVALLPEAKMVKLKTTVTGHWFGEGNNCGEFCQNTHSVWVNGNEEYNWEIIQECGENPLYPQGGTWFYDRAGWCPGMPATEQNLDLTPFINIGTDTEVAVDYNIEYDPYGNYVTEIYMVSYGEPNFTNDATVSEIIAPNKFKLNSRFNPICGNPKVKIKNSGASDLESLVISYGVTGQPVHTYNWTGNLKFLEEEVVQLPTINTDEFSNGTSQTFEVTISSPNGTGDEYASNNEIHSYFELAPVYNQQLIIGYKSNNSPAQNRYEVIDTEGNVLFSRNNLTASTVHVDTLNLTPGCYEFIAYDTEGDGMNNWPAGDGTGYIRFLNLDGSFNFALEEWFGESIKHSFISTAFPLGVEKVENLSLKLWPNPSKGEFSIEFSETVADYKIEVHNFSGKKVYETSFIQQIKGVSQLNLNKLESGFYLINIKSDKTNVYKKIMIEK